MDPSRRLAFLVLKEVETDGAYSNIALNRALAQPGEANPARVRSLVRGVLGNRIFLDYQIGRYLRKPSLKAKERILLRMGFYQMIFMGDSVPPHAAVSETVALASAFMNGRQGFINAVLRGFLRDGAKTELPEEDAGGGIERLCVRYSCLPWIAELWVKSYGFSKAEAMLAASLEEPPLTLRINPLRAPASYSPVPESGMLSGESYRKGWFSVQDAAAQKAVRVLAPRPADKVLDMCAAPGGKSCAMAELMGNEGSVAARDINPGRLKLVSREAERLGIGIISTEVFDAQLAARAEDIGAFDCVLCDVPCSGLGVMRRKPEIKYAGEEGVKLLPEKQLAILRNGAACVKKGGRLMYSTCTVNPAENGEVKDALLADGGFEVLAEEQIFPGDGGCDGFYYCLMRKKSL